MKRRGFLLGLLAAPAIIRTPGLLMPVRPVRPIYQIRDLLNERIIEAQEATVKAIQTSFYSEPPDYEPTGLTFHGIPLLADTSLGWSLKQHAVRLP